MPSLRGSDPPTSVPRARSIQIACPPPCGRSTGVAHGPCAASRRPSRRDAALHLQLAAVGEQPRQVERLLDVHAVFQQVGRNQVCPIGWKWPPMTPNGITASPSFVSMPGMMVCIGRLFGAMQFGWPRCDHEAGAAVLQHHARSLGQDAGAEALEQRVDERAGVAVPVHHAEVHRVAVRRQHRLARRGQVRQRAGRVDQRAQAGEVGGSVSAPPARRTAPGRPGRRRGRDRPAGRPRCAGAAAPATAGRTPASNPSRMPSSISTIRPEPLGGHCHTS